MTIVTATSLTSEDIDSLGIRPSSTSEQLRIIMREKHGTPWFIPSAKRIDTLLRFAAEACGFSIRLRKTSFKGQTGYAVVTGDPMTKPNF